MEHELIRKLAEFPSAVLLSAQAREAHRVVHYLHELAGIFHPYYNQHRVLDTEGHGKNGCTTHSDTERAKGIEKWANTFRHLRSDVDGYEFSVKFLVYCWAVLHFTTTFL